MQGVCLRKRGKFIPKVSLIQFTESKTYNLKEYGYKVGDTVDLFLVGGAGCGGESWAYNTSAVFTENTGGKGGSGYTLTLSKIILLNTNIVVSIGALSSDVTAKKTYVVLNGNTYQVNGGNNGSDGSSSGVGSGGSGGSGGGQGLKVTIVNGETTTFQDYGANGSDGGNGNPGGQGQGTTTRPFGDSMFAPYDNFGKAGTVMLRAAE